MKFGFTADIHFSRYGQDPVDEVSGLPERLDSIKASLSSIVESCKQRNVKDIVIGGDIFHTKSIIHSIAQNTMLEFFDNHPSIQFWVIDGNHDLSGKGADAISSLRSLKNVPNVEWITQKPLVLQNITFIPYSVNIVNHIKDYKSDILISHFGLSEGVLNSGISIVSNIGLADLRGKYKLILLGHYHKPQEIIEEDLSLYYAGSSAQLDWGEKGDQKRFLIVDSDTLEVESILTTGYRYYIELEITSENKDEIVKEAIGYQINGDYVKLVKKENLNLEGLEEFNIVDKTETDITNRGITSSMTQREKLQRYLQIKEIPEDEHDEYLEMGIEIINTCEVDS